MGFVNKILTERIISWKSSKFAEVFSPKVLLTAGLSDRGVARQNNEDNFLITRVPSEDNPRYLVCAVADGMGGHDCGEVASSEAVKILREGSARLNGRFWGEVNYQEWLENVVQTINSAIRNKSIVLQAQRSIGSTLVTALFAWQKVYVANVGDSRAYLFRQGSLRQITTDHSFVGLLVEKKLITPEEIYTHPRRGEIMRCLGQETDLIVDLFELDICIGDTVLLCSDGLWEMVRDNEIQSILQDNPDPSEACRVLVEHANQAGGTDNITAIVVRAGEVI